MHCIQIENPGPNSRLVLCELEKPHYDPEQLLIEVKATAVNRGDLLQRQGKYPPPAGEPLIPGLEIAGTVVAAGSRVHRFKVGDKVYGLVSGGGYAEYCALNQNLAQKIPDDWDFSYAAGIPEALMTAHATVFLLGQLKPYQTLLIHAAGSGITSLAIQMVHLLGAKIISTISNDEKMAKAAKLGPTTLIDYKKEDFETVLGPESVDVIVDFIGGNYFPKHLRLLKHQGKLIQIACMQGHLVECNLALMMQKRLQMNGFVLRHQSLFEKTTLWQSAHNQWGTALTNKEIIPVIDSIFSLNDIEKAHQRIQASAHFGKIIITI